MVGSQVLCACEAAAGVRIVAGALATQDVDLLWGARQRVRFLADPGVWTNACSNAFKRPGGWFTETGRKPSSAYLAVRQLR